LGIFLGGMGDRWWWRNLCWSRSRSRCRII